jgi:hypothetical protein
MSRSLIGAAVIALVLSMNVPARAATERQWLGALFTDLRATTSHDFHQDRVQQLVPSWLMTLNAFDTAWPVTIEATTTHDPAQVISVFPASPVTVDGVTTYSWSGNAPVFTQFLISSGIEVRRDLGFTARRELLGGRHVATGGSQRELRITIRASVALPSTFVTVASFGSAPVTVTTASCPGSTPHPFPQFGGLVSWQLGALAAGDEVQLTCILDLQNAAAFKASFMPDVQISATRSVVVSEPAEGSEVVIPSDTLRGSVTFRVEPGADEVPMARSQIVDRRGLHMTGEDRVLARGHD